jgi:hypothetical protein
MTTAATVCSTRSVWQETDEQRQSRHSWPDQSDHRFSAMSLLVVVLVLLAVALVATAVVVVVRRDGYGTLEPPRSHPAWDDLTPLSRPHGLA